MDFVRTALFFALVAVGWYQLRIHWILRDNGEDASLLRPVANYRRFCALLARETEPVLRIWYRRIQNGLYFSLAYLGVALFFLLHSLGLA